MEKSYSFYAYVDEAGDEGFNFAGRTREWFILSAVVTHRENDLATMNSIIKYSRNLFKMEKDKEIHFRKLNHEKKVAYLNRIVEVGNLKAVTVAMHKPSLDVKVFGKNGVLYSYACRLLLERVSWLCKDYYNGCENAGDGYPLIIFSKRKQMSYDNVRAYFEMLQKQVSYTTIDWDFIKLSAVEVWAASQRMGLQIADAFASSAYSALNVNDYGNVETKYLDILQPLLYSHDGKTEGYGYKEFRR